MKYKWIETSCGFFAVEDEKNEDEPLLKKYLKNETPLEE
ncbi:hypothetical protein Mzhil_0068 [Methanosalsum zhilinae DSM 4017]|uniref:Uncharacterized protein n=1 Tax=Methanosalsum zhilinae (strain DSM 4017 / NBRC 107636 / OCM 62 / WeN5) TaxID=679901 RepID=F7XMT2_METZD|nr:hypothetical protein Mzhil_0068 [Methanosalsum zhilinae DSM 4017]